jgi:MFS family permease
MTRPARTDSITLDALWKATFLVSLPFGVLSFALPIYGKMLKASALEIGALFSAVALVPVIVRPFLGRILDRWGRRPFFLAGLASYTVSMVILCVAKSMLLLGVGRFVQGMGQALLWLSAYAIVADVSQANRRGRGFGAIDEAMNRGALVGVLPGLLGIGLMQFAGLAWGTVWPVLFGAYAVAACCSLFLGARHVGETRPAASQRPVVVRPLTLQIAALMGIVFVTGASTAMVWPIIVIFLQDRLKAGAVTLAVAYLPAALISSFLPSRLGRITDRFGRKPMMALGLVIGAAASALMPQLSSIALLAILWGVDSLGFTASSPAERAFVADIAGSDARGVSYGLYTFAYFLGTAIGPLAGGWLYDNLGRAFPFYANSAMLMLAAVLVMTLLREPDLERQLSSGTLQAPRSLRPRPGQPRERAPHRTPGTGAGSP